MDSTTAYLIIIIGVVLAIYLLYISYQTYQKNPSRWMLREFATEWFSALMR
jgi:F0F1-type ATP synthase membrane subunit a